MIKECRNAELEVSVGSRFTHNVPASGRLLGATRCGAEPPSHQMLPPGGSPTAGPAGTACPVVPWGSALWSPLLRVVTAVPVPSSLAPHLLLHCPRLPVGWGSGSFREHVRHCCLCTLSVLTDLHPHITRPGAETSLLDNGKYFCPPYGAYLFTRLRNYFSFLLVAFSFPLNLS